MALDTGVEWDDVLVQLSFIYFFIDTKLQSKPTYFKLQESLITWVYGVGGVWQRAVISSPCSMAQSDGKQLSQMWVPSEAVSLSFPCVVGFQQQAPQTNKAETQEVI